MQYLARMLSDKTERRVVDQTGLKGRYDFTLRWDLNAQSMDEAGTSLYTALTEQLGISLEGSKAMLDVIAVDRGGLAVGGLNPTASRASCKSNLRRNLQIPGRCLPLRLLP